MAEYDDVMRILMENSSKPFVQRILNPGAYPTLDLGGGNYATHKMSWSSIDTPNGRRYFVHPTVLHEGGKLLDYGDKAFDRVMKTGDYIEFDDPSQAHWFSKKYKAAWDRPSVTPERIK